MSLSILRSQKTKLSEWCTLNAKTFVDGQTGRHEDYHSLIQFNYLTSLCILPDGTIPLVKQFRPALERFTLELPGGLHDNMEKSEYEVMSDEIREETGYILRKSPTLLGTLYPDTGRLENRLFAFFTPIEAKRSSNWMPEDGIEIVHVSYGELCDLIEQGEFIHALHLAVLWLAKQKGFLSKL